jgi:hypothetical protein
VSQAKFDKEIVAYHTLEDEYRMRGWFLLEARFPRALVMLTAPHLRPASVVVGVLFDYTNYDARPPSVRLVNPFSGEPFLTKDLPTKLWQAVPTPPVVAGLPTALATQAMMQGADDEVPFFCHPGVREYHDHPAHSGDPWELRRAEGEGRFVRLLDLIWRYGVKPLTYNLNMSMSLAPKLDAIEP